MFIVLASLAYSCNLLVVPKPVKMPKNELVQAIKKLDHDIFWLELVPLESEFHVVYFRFFVGEKSRVLDNSDRPSPLAKCPIRKLGNICQRARTSRVI